MPFLAYELSLDLVAQLEPPLAAVRKHSAAEGAQLDNAAMSVVRNLAEGNGRKGRDRMQHFAIAYGSLLEVRATLDIAVRRRWLTEAPMAAATAQRLGGMLWKLSGR